MARLALVATVALILAAPASASPTAQSVQIGPTHALYVPAVASARGRVILLHGLGETADEEAIVPTNVQLVDGLTAAGFQVVMPDLPYHSDAVPYEQRKSDLRASFADGGGGYLRTWDTEFEAVNAWADKTHGRLPLTVAGISWGGYNTLEAACRSTRPFAYVASMPVVYVPWLAEFTGLHLPAMTISSTCVRKISKRQGLIQYGTQDIRVGSVPGKVLGAALARQGHTTVQPFDLGHTTTPETVSAVLAWIERHGLTTITSNS